MGCGTWGHRNGEPNKGYCLGVHCLANFPAASLGGAGKEMKSICKGETMFFPQFNIFYDVLVIVRTGPCPVCDLTSIFKPGGSEQVF